MADDVPADVRHAAARILDERAGDEVRAGLIRPVRVREGRFGRFGEFAVAVVDHEDGRADAELRGELFHAVRGVPDLTRGERRAVGVALRALNVDHFEPLSRRAHGFADRREIEGIRGIGRQRDRAEGDAPVRERAFAVGGGTAVRVDADDGEDGVVGDARDREHRVAGAEDAEEGDREGVGAGEEGGAHETGGREENGCREGVDAVAAHVAVAVSSGRREEGLGDLRLTEAVEDVFGVFARNAVDVGEDRREDFLGARGFFADGRRDVHVTCSLARRFSSFVFLILRAGACGRYPQTSNGLAGANPCALHNDKL